MLLRWILKCKPWWANDVSVNSACCDTFSYTWQRRLLDWLFFTCVLLAAGFQHICRTDGSKPVNNISTQRKTSSILSRQRKISKAISSNKCRRAAGENHKDAVTVSNDRHPYEELPATEGDTDKMLGGSGTWRSHAELSWWRILYLLAASLPLNADKNSAEDGASCGGKGQTTSRVPAGEKRLQFQVGVNAESSVDQVLLFVFQVKSYFHIKGNHYANTHVIGVKI